MSITTATDIGANERCESCGAFISSENDPQNKEYCPSCEDEFEELR